MLLMEIRYCPEGAFGVAPTNDARRSCTSSVQSKILRHFERFVPLPVPPYEIRFWAVPPPYGMGRTAETLGDLVSKMMFFLTKIVLQVSKLAKIFACGALGPVSLSRNYRKL